MAFYALAKTNELVDGFTRSVKLPNITLLLIVVAEQVYIIEDRCPHMDVPLADGDLEAGPKIRCRAHGIAFELDTGVADGSWADTLECLKHFEPVYRDYSVGVELEETQVSLD